MVDRICVEGLELQACIGVPDEERSSPQRLTLNITLEPRRDFRGLEDDLRNTVDYFEVCQAVKAFSLARPRRLIETLAEEIAGLLLARYPLTAVDLELRKYILPDTEFVAVRLRREGEGTDHQGQRRVSSQVHRPLA